jgi:1-acyl-sn-glycerol-3-phosphate acyltransferase
MIKANRKPWFDKLFTSYLERLMRKHFSHFYIVNEFPAIPTDVSVAFTPNHFSWWDGFLIQKVQREYLPNKSFHILMLANQLKVYKMFNWMGAYGVNLADTKSLIETVKYTRELLSDSKNLTVIYPQGEILPYGIRPLQLKRGISQLVGGLGTKSLVIPVGFKVEFGEEKLPSLYCRFGEAIIAGEVEKDFVKFENGFTSNILELDKTTLLKQNFKDVF